MLYANDGRYKPLATKISFDLENYMRDWIENNYQDGMNIRELELVARDSVSMAFLIRRHSPPKTGD